MVNQNTSSAAKPLLLDMKYQRIIARASVPLFFLALAIVSAFITYTVLTLNIYYALGMIGTMILQKLFINKNLTIINFLKKYCFPHAYFNKFQKVYEADVPDEGILFTVHPHGVWSLAIMLGLNSGDDPYSRMTQLGSRFILNLPLIGLFLRIWGIQSVHAANMNKLMAKRVNIGVVPGGYQEATITSHQKFRIYIKKRKGFIKMALKTGYKICPVLIMNEHKMFNTTDFALKFRLLLNKLKMPAAVFCGRFGMFPDYNLDIYTVIGKPIELPTIQKPTTEDVKKWHKHYIDVVTAMYEKHKGLNSNSPFEIY